MKLEETALNRSQHTILVLNADDYGLAPGVGRAIRELADNKRISATSCMTSSPHWQSEGELLKPLLGKIDIGLHITLTDLPCLGHMPKLAPEGLLPSFGKLSKHSWINRLPLVEIKEEIIRQVDAFEAIMGCIPDHLDGHHHVQQLHGIAEIVLETAANLGPKVYVRTAHTKMSRILNQKSARMKALALAAAGRHLRRKAARRSVVLNEGFAGFYNFKQSCNYQKNFELFLKNQTSGAIIMCHPGIVDEELKNVDSLITPREHEYQFFRSELFLNTLEANQIQVARMTNIA